MSYAIHSDAAKEYREFGTRHEIETASPHRLIQLMMERVLAKIAVAKGHMERAASGEKGQNICDAISEKGRNISDAISIISGLRASLNHEPNARLSSNFDALYDYMSRRLVESNLKNDPGGLEEVAGLMRELKSAWDAVGEELARSENSASNSN